MGAASKDYLPSGKPSRGRVLFVTSETSYYSLEIAQLEEAGFAVATATGVTKAIVSLHRTRPHAVILDIALPDFTAKEMTKKELTNILTNHSSGRVIVIFVGKERVTEERQGEAISNGASDYFQLPNDLTLLIVLLTQLVPLKIEIERLKAERDHDKLTRLATRHVLVQAIRIEVERWRRYQIPSSLLSLDIDRMTRINDTFGHPAGDRAIAHVAGVLAAAVRDNDTASRTGGERFHLLLSGADEASALAVAEKLRSSLSADPVEDVGQITVSIGVASCPAHADSERSLYQAADGALVHAKKEGRNCTVVAPLISKRSPTGL